MRLIHRPLLPALLLLVAAILATGVLLTSAKAHASEVTATYWFEFSFDEDAGGWVAGFADLPIDYDQQAFDLDSGHRSLPDGLEGGGMYLQGHNHSGDLFMYLKHQLDGLPPNTEFTVSASVDLATNVGSELVGIGGSPGSSVLVKVGASTVEPTAVEGDNRHLRMNIDKGNQWQSGTDMVIIGDIAHREVVDEEYRIKMLHFGRPVSVETDDSGRVWLIVGTDSGFEGFTAVYFTRIIYQLTYVQWPWPEEAWLPPTGGAGVSAWTMAGVAGAGAVMVALGVGLLVRYRRRRT